MGRMETNNTDAVSGSNGCHLATLVSAVAVLAGAVVATEAKIVAGIGALWRSVATAVGVCTCIIGYFILVFNGSITGISFRVNILLSTLRDPWLKAETLLPSPWAGWGALAVVAAKIPWVKRARIRVGCILNMEVKLLELIV